MRGRRLGPLAWLTLCLRPKIAVQRPARLDPVGRVGRVARLPGASAAVVLLLAAAPLPAAARGQRVVLVDVKVRPRAAGVTTRAALPTTCGDRVGRGRLA
jgi:hypothetical protein